uniref:Pentacotripeptide-repeat region of PRORP domain-containing protein n=1 Tax=Salix viminalis TaxID=40686 RepID=A0A6N2LWZ5_SALVM
MLKKGCDPDICTYNTLIHGFLKMGLFDKAWVLWNLMSDLGIQPNEAIAKNGCGLDHSSLSNFDKINSSAGLEQEIELILREITRIDLNLCNVAGSIYVRALCEGGKTEAALACFKNVASAGCIPLLFTFNSLIKRLFQDGRFEDVKSLFEIMQNEGIVPNLETYLIMVKEYCKQEDLASAFGILDQMKEMGPKPNVAIYAASLLV